MDKFSKVQKEGIPEKEDIKIIFEEKDLKIVNYKDTNIVEEKDLIVILPYIKYEGIIILKHEYIPAYNYFYRHNDQFKNVYNYLSVITGEIEVGESYTNAIRRILHKDTGIVLSNLYNIELKGSYFINKTNISKYIPVVLELNFNDYKETIPNYNDIKIIDKISKCIKISLADINDIKAHDLITSYMLNTLKTDLNIR